MTLDLILDIGWKSGLVAAAALIAAALLRRRPAVERVTILRTGLVLIVLLPLLALALPKVSVEAWRAPPPEARPATAPALVVYPPSPGSTTARIEPSAPVEATPAWPRIDIPTVLLGLYGFGVAILLARLGGGLLTLWRWSRRARPADQPAWTEALRRAASGRRQPRLLISPHVASPLSWGTIILVHPDTVARPEQASAILEHEMAHLRRGDWPMLMISQLATAALWFNPLVWMLQLELARQSELAADASAVRRMDRTDYAQALVTLAGRRAVQAGLSISAPRGELYARVAAVLTERKPRGSRWSTALSGVACVAIATPLAALELTGELPEPIARAAAPAVRLLPRLTLAPTPTADRDDASRRAAASAPVRAPDQIPAAMAPTLRQRDQGLAMMEVGARALELQARHLRLMARSMDGEERESLMADAAELDDEARDLRAEAVELAAKDPSELRPMTPADEEMFQAAGAELDHFEASGDVRFRATPEGTVQIGADRITMRPAPSEQDLAGSVLDPKAKDKNKNKDEGFETGG